MSVTDPLLKQLKGHAAKLLNESANGSITDKSLALQPFCETLETIFLQGLIENFPMRRAECWFWMENIASPRFQTAFTYCTAVNSVRENLKVNTHRGYFRLLMRICLVRGCIHVPVEKLVHVTSSTWQTYQPDSILGDEILGEILLSVLLQCSKLKFQLQLENATFLDETWQLGQYEKLEIVPCKSLGICVGFAYGKGIVVRVDPSSVSAEDDKIVVGDVIDEINGYAVTAAMRSKLSSIMRQASGKPIMLSVIKAKLSNGNIYSPLRKLYLKLGLNSQELQEVKNSQDVKAAIGEEHKAGFAVDFVGEVVIGEKGDVAQIAGAITKALSGAKRPAQLEILEMGVRVSDRHTEKVIAKHSYMEISSCGRQERLPYFFAYIAGDCSCNVASEFTCYVFHSRDEDQIVNILHSIDFHAAASLCTPSRAALLTGRLGLRTGVTTNFGTESVAGLPHNETTLAEILKTVGYRTSMLGKWHLGTKPGFHPIDRGFDEYLGVPYSIDMGCTSPPGLNLPPAAPCPHQSTGLSEVDDGALALPLYRNRIITHQPVSLSSLSKYYAEFGEHFIRDNKTNAPFFLYAAFSHVHVPLAHSKKFSNFTGRGEFADTLAEMDSLAGRLIRAATSRGESTLIWFISDNGNWEAKCSLAGTSGPFRGEWQHDLSRGGGGSASKQTVWEGGHRVPGILHWKPNIKEGRVSGALASALDIVPTMSELAGAELPTHRIFDGQSHAQALLHGQKIISHQELFHPNSGAAGVIGEIGAVRVGRYKTVYYSGGAEGCSQSAGPAQTFNPPLIFDLRHDQAESTPLAGQAGKLVLRRATAALERFLASVRADNRSTVDYSHDPSAKPCCSTLRPACACPWDLLIPNL